MRRASTEPAPEGHDVWRLLPFSRRPAGEQMALGEAMLSALGGPSLRWWRSAPEALIIGRGQPLASVDLDACRSVGCEVYRRATGGTAVLSGFDLLNLDVALPAGHALALLDVIRSYAWLGEAMAEGLRALGVTASAVSPDQVRAQAAALRADDPVRLACHATLSPHEVVVGGRKLAGLAQARRRAGILLQAGVLLRWQPERLVPLLAASAAAGHAHHGRRRVMVAALSQRAVGLEDLLGPLDCELVIDKLNGAIAREAGAKLVASAWSEAELTAAAEARFRYAPLFVAR
jgi:lipoate-protein ligase A